MEIGNSQHSHVLILLQLILVAMALMMAFFHMPKLDEPIITVRCAHSMHALPWLLSLICCVPVCCSRHLHPMRRLIDGAC